eukprot:GHVS01064161.1.p1 GENE.GHVS01064161.1~~GHVS01064161.1.p1  ORF type:complete len:733 (-),score=92.21 GHVS01064161.1:703-2811(-)
MGYPWSKWAAEIILTEARAMGLPVTIYRLPVTCMTYETGYTHTDNVNIPVTAAALQEGMMPRGIIFTALSAADVVCNLLIELSQTENRQHWIYHLVDTRVVIRPQFIEWFSQLGLHFESVTPDDYLNAIKARGRDSPLFEYIPMVQFWRRYWFADNERDEPLPISTRNILDDLPHQNSPWPPPREVFKRSFLYNLRTHFYKANAVPIQLNINGTLEDCLRSCGMEKLRNASFFLKPGMLLNEALAHTSASFAGRLLTYRLVRQQLLNAVYMEKMQQTYPQIQTKAVRQPVFIVGLDRTSTTLLQWLLAMDPTNRTPRFAEMALPYGMDGTYRPHDLNCTSWNQDPRVPAAQDILDGQLALTGRSGLAELLSADLPYDDSLIFEQCGRSYTLCAALEAPGYHNWYFGQIEGKMDPVYVHHKQFLQHLQWQKPGERWVLSSACHMVGMDALFRTYPDATIVWIHRDPRQVVESWCSYSRGLKKVLYTEPNLAASDQVNLRAASTHLNKALAFRESNPQLSSRFIDIHHDALTADPIGTVRKVYKACGWQLSQNTLKAVQLFLVENRHLRSALDTAPPSGFGRRKSIITADAAEPTAVKESPTAAGASAGARAGASGGIELDHAEVRKAFHSYFRSKYSQISRRGTIALMDQKLTEAKAWLSSKNTRRQGHKISRVQTQIYQMPVRNSQANGGPNAIALVRLKTM